MKVFNLDKEQQEIRKQLPDELTFPIQKWSLIQEFMTSHTDIPDETREHLQKEYEEGKLETWFKREVRNS